MDILAGTVFSCHSLLCFLGLLHLLLLSPYPLFFFSLTHFLHTSQQHLISPGPILIYLHSPNLLPSLLFELCSMLDMYTPVTLQVSP